MSKLESWVNRMVGLIYVALALVVPVSAIDYERLSFENVGLEDGLSQSVVKSICQDSFGFMWFGTQSGLNRYDGKNIKIYRHDPFDSDSLSNDDIFSLLPDEDGKLWVGTSRGLNYFDTRTGRAVRFMENPALMGLATMRIWSLMKDGNDALWVGADDGLYRIPKQQDYNPDALIYRHYAYRPGAENGPSAGEVDQVIADGDGNLWIAMWGGGLSFFDREQFQHFRHDPDNPDSLSDNLVKTIAIGLDGDLWVGTDSGLDRFDPKTGVFTHYSDVNGPLPADGILTISVDSESGRLWVGTKLTGLHILNPANNDVVTYRHNPQDTHGLSSNRVSSFYTDQSGIKWIGTARGLNTFSPLNQRFKLFRHQPDNPRSLPQTLLGGVFVDRDNMVWVGTLGGGLVRIDQANNEYRRFFHDPDNPQSLPDNTIRNIFEDSLGRLWIGSSDGLALCLDKENGIFRRLDLDLPIQENISAIAQDRAGVFWIGVWEEGLHRVTLNEGRITSISSYRADPMDSQSISQHLIRFIFEDRDGELWVGTENGLNRRDLTATLSADHLFTVYRNDPEDRNSPSSNSMFCAAETEDGQLWFGTAGGGLMRFDKESGHFRHYLEQDGLPSNVVFRILVDDEGYLWMSTTRGLSRFDRNTEQFRNFDVSDGLQSNEFAPAAAKAPNGELFFAGFSGMNAFFPEQIRDNPYRPKTLITGFRALGADRFQERDVFFQDRVELSYKDRALYFTFASLDYTSPQKNRYQYKLEGSSDVWIDHGFENSVSFFNLPSGNYRLLVRGSNNDGVWSEQPAALRIHITPPWWRTPWAYLCYILAAFGALAYYLRMQQIKLVREREISGQLQQANDQLTLADRIKDEFLANTSHELRTPLNGMIGLADSLLEGVAGPVNDRQGENLRLIVSSGMRLATLVNDILDFAKMRRGAIVLHRRSVDPFGIAKLVMGLNRPLLRGKNVIMYNDVPQDCPPVYADENRLEQIMHNLVGNAVKFTEEGEVHVSVSEDMGRLVIHIRDTGVGIADDRQDRIFESFEQAEGGDTRGHGGAGLGLAITRKLVELHGGSIHFTSLEGEGSHFWFDLPLATEEDLSEAPPSMTSSREEYEAILRLSEDFVDVTARPEGAHGDFKILIVDDEPVNLQVLTNFLSMRGYGLTKAASGAEALDKVREATEPFDLILLDVMMPRISGFDVCRKIRETYPPHALPIILLTAKTGEGDVVHGFEAGANDYLVKPVSKSELMVRIQTHLDLLASTRSLRETNAKLEGYNRKLEQNVEERTEEIRERNRELEMLDGVVQIINREVELDRVLQTLLEEAVSIFDHAEAGSFLIHDPGRAVFRFGAVLGYPQDLWRDTKFTLVDLAERFDLEGYDADLKVLQGDDYLEKDRFLKVLPRPASSLVMRIRIDDAVEGFLILDNGDDPMAFDRHDVDKLRRLEAHAVSAVAKARTLEEVRRKNEELTIAQTQLILQERMVYLGNMITGIAHEIQNPLNFVNNFSAISSDITEELSDQLMSVKDALAADHYDEMRELVGDLAQNSSKIQDHGRRMERIVRNMMTQSELGSRERQTIRLDRTVEEQVKLMGNSLKAQEQQDPGFDMQLEPVTVDAVASDLIRAMVNMFKNAVDAVEEKREADSSFEPRILVTVSSDQTHASLVVRDNGIGMSKADIEKVFTPFFTTKPTGKGTGLGMTICYEIIVQGHKGEITVDSAQGEFTEVRVRLPLT